MGGKMADIKFFDIQVSGQDNPLATYDTYEEAICALYQTHQQDPNVDVYIKEYEISEYGNINSNFVRSYELDILGSFKCIRDFEGVNDE
jgi:hypothetical protein